MTWKLLYSTPGDGSSRLPRKPELGFQGLFLRARAATLPQKAGGQERQTAPGPSTSCGLTPSPATRSAPLVPVLTVPDPLGWFLDTATVKWFFKWWQKSRCLKVPFNIVVRELLKY